MRLWHSYVLHVPYRQVPTNRQVLIGRTEFRMMEEDSPGSEPGMPTLRQGACGGSIENNMHSTSPTTKTAAPVNSAEDDQLMMAVSRQVGGCSACRRRRLLTDVCVCWVCPSLFSEDSSAMPVCGCPRNN